MERRSDTRSHRVPTSPNDAEAARARDSNAARGRRNVLISLRYPAPYELRLKTVFGKDRVTFLSGPLDEAFGRYLKDAHVAIIKGDLDERFLDARNLKWVHCNKSGLDGFAPDALFETGLAVTSVSGRSAPVLAEHALHFMLALTYRSRAFDKAQRRRIWGLSGQNALRGLFGRRVLIVGCGHTARALIPRCLALGMEVDVFRRKDLAAGFDGVRAASIAAGDRIDDLLPRADFVVLAASLNDSSHRMLGPRQLGVMKDGAILVNVARAALVDTPAMKRALGSGKLAGAGLDVADREPLPPWDMLWGAPNVLITPHVTPRMPDREAEEIAIISENYRRFCKGLPLRNRLMPEDAYNHRPAPPFSRPERWAMRLWKRLAAPRGLHV